MECPSRPFGSERSSTARNAVILLSSGWRINGRDIWASVIEDRTISSAALTGCSSMSAWGFSLSTC